MYSLGIDIGFASVKVSLTEDLRILHNAYRLHRGKIVPTLLDLLREVCRLYGAEKIAFAATCGGDIEPGGLHRCDAVSALVEGVALLDPSCTSIIEIGGQSAKYVTGCDDRARLRVAMNSDCAAGTGSFLEEQLSRLGLRLEDYAAGAARAKRVPRIAGRCSVFAKTDITHLLQEGVPVEDILVGLAYALMGNYRSSVIGRLPLTKPLFFAGGVALNGALLAATRDLLDLKEGELVVSPASANAGAIGAAALARKEERAFDMAALLRLLEDERLSSPQKPLPRLPRLEQNAEDGRERHRCAPLPEGSVSFCHLGVDVGSTSTNIVLADDGGRIVAYRYLRTFGDPVAALREGFESLRRELGPSVRIEGAGVTGSGRYRIGELIGADVVRDEITAQARAAVALNEKVDTVFEIGGQDSKYIGIRDGAVVDFQMNKICAAGTGSFLEEQAKKFDIAIEALGDIALNSASPIDLGERCTVFMETSIAAALARGAAIDDIAAGLCYSVVRNYLHRVVGRKRIGETILLQGGIAHNEAIVSAFRALTGKEITVAPFFSVTGAYGAALLARDGKGDGPTAFRGLDVLDGPGTEGTAPTDAAESAPDAFSREMDSLIFDEGESRLDPSKKTVGIPRALFTFGMYPLFGTFFRELGLNVVLSDPTDERTLALEQRYAQDEICFPVKLVTGHVAQLVERKVDYIFFPDLHTVMHPDSPSRQNYGCAYMQLAFKLVNQIMGLSGKGITLLAPTIAFNRGKSFMTESFARLGALLGRTEEETTGALAAAMKGFLDFEHRLRERGKERIGDLKEDEVAFVLISKIYGIADRALNRGIPDKLRAMGYKVLAFFDLPDVDASAEHPNMYWPFGQHILEPAYLVREHPNLYALFLTHHCCGPDSILLHYFREIMGDKPYLNIEIDEHASAVGIATRVEAFVNSLDRRRKKAEAIDVYREKIDHRRCPIATALLPSAAGDLLYIPRFRPYSRLFVSLLRRWGFRAEELADQDELSLRRGRRQTLTNELLSLTVLLGSLFRTLEERAPEGPVDRTRDERSRGRGLSLLMPQSEGAAVDGQYGRLLRTRLDEEGYGELSLVSPFLEDLPDMSGDEGEAIFLCLLAGDMVNNAPRPMRESLLDRLCRAVAGEGLDGPLLARVAREIVAALRARTPGKTLLALGEPFVLYGDFMNDGTFASLEEKGGHRLVYAPLAECLWLFWSDTIDTLPEKRRAPRRERLRRLRALMEDLSRELAPFSPFADDLDGLVACADASVGLYSGAFGRYRSAKAIDGAEGIDGVIAVSSTYENTAVLLNALASGPSPHRAKPLLNLTFDGNENGTNVMKVDAFVRYI